MGMAPTDSYQQPLGNYNLHSPQLSQLIFPPSIEMHLDKEIRKFRIRYKDLLFTLGFDIFFINNLLTKNILTHLPDNFPASLFSKILHTFV